MTIVGNTPSRLCRALAVVWIVAAARSQPDGNGTSTTVAEVFDPADNGSSAHDVTPPSSSPSAAETTSSEVNGTESGADPEQNVTPGRRASQNGTRGGTSANDADVSRSATTTAKFNPQSTPTPMTTERSAVDEIRITNGADHETTSLATSRSQEGRVSSGLPRDGVRTVSPRLLDEIGRAGFNGTTEIKDQNEASSPSSANGLPDVNWTDSEVSRKTGNSSTVSGVEVGRTTTVKSLAPNQVPPAAKPNTQPRTTPSPRTGKRNETVATIPNITSPHNDSALVKSAGLWKNCSSDCWGIAIGIPVAGVIIIALVLTISLLCIKPRNFSVPKSSGSTELDSLNGPTRYNTGEPPGVTTEVIAPECFTNVAITV